MMSRDAFDYEQMLEEFDELERGRQLMLRAIMASPKARRKVQVESRQYFASGRLVFSSARWLEPFILPEYREQFLWGVRIFQRARDRIVLANQGLVKTCALWYARKYHQDVSDLIQEGNIGLLTAIDRFDPKVARFSTYAVFWIRQAISRFVAKDSLIRIPEHVGRTPVKKLDPQLQQSLEENGGKYPLLSLDTTLIHEKPMRERLATDPEQPLLIEDLDRKRQIRRALAELPIREALAICMRFGLEGFRPLSLDETARRLGMSREGVRQLEKRAINRLRQRKFLWLKDLMS